jgi:hypothetical protein
MQGGFKESVVSIPSSLSAGSERELAKHRTPNPAALLKFPVIFPRPAFAALFQGRLPPAQERNPVIAEKTFTAMQGPVLYGQMSALSLPIASLHRQFLL